MKGKKLLASVLSAAMVLSTMALPAFADDTNVVSTTEELVAALADTTVNEITISGTIDVSSVDFSNVNGTKIKGDSSDGEDILQFKGAPKTVSIAFADLTMEWPNANYQGLQHSTKITYDNCTIKGQPFLYAKEEIFNDCTFIQESPDAYNVWTYGAENVGFNNCTFNSAGKSVLVYAEKDGVSTVVDVKDCNFTASVPVEGKAAIEIDSSLIPGEYTLNITEKTTATGFGTGSTSGNSLYNVKKYKVVTDDTDNSKKLNAEIKVDGKTVMPLSDENMTKVFGESVARIGGNVYTALEDAVKAAQDGATVTLTNDVTESIKIDKGQNITLDLNGKTLTNTDGKHTIENYGVLVVEDSSQDKTAKVDNITNGRIPFVNYEGGVATLNGGSFDRSLENGKVGATDKGCNSCYTIKNWGIMTINENVSVNNNTYKSGGSSTIGNGYQNGGTFDNHSGVTSANVELTINGGKFSGGLNTIKNDDWAKLLVNGGVFENNTQQCIMNWNEATITGGIFTGKPNSIYNGYDNDSMDKGTLKITGGEFNGEIQVYDVNKKGQTIISGGSFSTDVSDYCEDGFKAKFVNGKYVVDEDKSTDTVALKFVPTADERVYNIVLNGDGKDINRLNAAEFKFNLDTADKITYEIKAADKLTTLQPDADKYEFHFDGKDFEKGTADSGANITIGTVTFNGYGEFKFGATEGRVTATTKSDNLVTEFVVGGADGKGTLKIEEDANKITDGKITVPTHTLTINVLMNHPVTAQTADYQDMTVAISGGDLAGKVLTYKLGNENKNIDETTKTVAQTNGSYNIKTSLTQNRIYTVTVSGAGYRTARYTVTMTADKTMNVWNNVMSNEITVVDDTKARKNFLAGDIIRDGIINIYDLSAVVAYFGTDKLPTSNSTYAKYDLNRDGVIDMMDISIVLTSWGE